MIRVLYSRRFYKLQAPGFFGDLKFYIIFIITDFFMLTTTKLKIWEFRWECLKVEIHHTLYNKQWSKGLVSKGRICETHHKLCSKSWINIYSTSHVNIIRINGILIFIGFIIWVTGVGFSTSLTIKNKKRTSGTYNFCFRAWDKLLPNFHEIWCQ